MYYCGEHTAVYGEKQVTGKVKGWFLGVRWPAVRSKAREGKQISEKGSFHTDRDIQILFFHLVFYLV